MNKEQSILTASDLQIYIQDFNDIMGALGACFGASSLILTENDLAPQFFDLHTGLAGELFQKFINYRKKVAIVVPDFDAYGERFSELAYEHTTHNMIRFVHKKEEAISWLNKSK